MANSAQIDLRDKMRLEVPLRQEIDEFTRAVVRDYVREVSGDGLHQDANDKWDEFLALLLFRHYRRVGGVFGARTGPRLPASVRTTPAEQEIIDTALRRRFGIRAPAQAEIINATTQRQMLVALAAAREAASQLRTETGRDLTREQVAAAAGLNLNRAMAGRKEGIVTLETQAPAEQSKLVEAEILSGVRPEAAGQPSPFPSPVKKAWLTQGDDRVRDFPHFAFSHVRADLQVKNQNEPYIVTGERLMYPGDMSLGASLGNVIRCRCSSVVDADVLQDIRIQRRMMEIAI